jgi:cellobiose-specific phosphotransferase system component IIC
VDSFWQSLVPQLGPLLVATIGLIAALAVKSGRRRRLDNLKAGAETLAHLTETKHQDAVKNYMDKQSAALGRQLDPRQTWIVIAVIVIISSSVALIWSITLDISSNPAVLREFASLIPTFAAVLIGLVVSAIGPASSALRFAREKFRLRRRLKAFKDQNERP